LLTATPARPAGEADLIGMINDYRSAPRECEGRREPVARPLAPSPTLAAVDPGRDGRFGEALKASGYRAATATSILFSGPGNASAIRRLIEARYCRTLLDPRYSQIGVARSGTSWRINLARPLVPEGLGDWREAGQAVLRLVNLARAQARACGDEQFQRTRPLAWNEALAEAALAHSRDMASRDYFSHADPSGASVRQRATRAGYRWRYVGENIAAGLGSPEQVVAGWLASPGHCANLMSPDFVDMGAAYAVEPASKLDIYWTQTFGAR
jgi:hypothetical protein